MNSSNMNYPDLSKPLQSSAVSYPDLSKPINKTQEIKSNPSLPISNDIIQNIKSFGFDIPTNEKEREQYKKIIPERFLGATQELANYPIKAINLFKNNPISEFNFAPNTPAAQQGKIGGDIASFFMPGEAIGAGISGLSYLPKIGEGINTVSQGIKSSPWLNALMNVGRTGGETALFNATQNPQDAKNAALMGAGVGGGMQTAANLLTTQNPIIRLIGKLGLGAGLGYGLGHPAVGAMVGASLPEIGKFLGIGGQNALAEQMLEGLTYKDVSRAKAANDRLGTSITPAQASGNYVTAATEGNLKRTPQGAQHGFRLEQLQGRQQTNAINKMLDSIYTPTAENEKNINNLYQQANQFNVNPAVVNQMKTNPIMENAFRQVKNDPAFENIPEHNYEYLSEVDRQLNRDYQAAQRNNPNSAYAINQVKNLYNNFLKQSNPLYEQATAAAQPKIVRRNIEEKLNKNEEDYTGKNFYSKFLSARKPYQDLLRQTKNFPQAQEAIKDMRQGWKNLSNMKSVSQGEAQAKAGIGDMRDQFKIIINAMKKMSGATQDVKGLDYIYSKDWDNDFARIMQNQNQKDRNRNLLTLMGKIGTAYGLTKSQ